MFVKLFNPIRLFSAIVLIMALAACDNPVEDDDDHADAEALALFLNGEEIVTVAEGVVTGAIALPVGSQTNLITIEFRDHDGDEIHDEDLDDGFSLGWVVGDASIATFAQEGRWGFRITGVTVGTTQLTLHLLHSGHPDFTTPPIPVEVTPAAAEGP
jgi:hypothetical protein